ncbi:MAG: ABC transporter ATP-binding protein [Candidatus Riflebacteria bacterium]|nr:ABC transporter ATP-binding protein [Candidatus Riflebacteria bacterium]
MIEFQGINSTAGSFRLVDISLAIPKGDCHVIVGPTGAGKTCLLETLIGLRKITSGSILLQNNEISGLPPNERKIAFVPQDTCLFPNMTVKDNIYYGTRATGISDSSAAPFIEHLIEFLRIGELLDRWPKHLSGGEKQRVALARALATKPLLLVLDEPFSAIDHSFREDIRRLLKDLLEEFHTTTLIVTHDLDEAFFLGNNISVMMNGQILQTGSRDDIYYYPKSYLTASFFGIRNIFEAKVLKNIPEGGTLLLWEDLHEKLTVHCRCRKKKFEIGQKLYFGIRPEAIYILRSSTDQEERNNLFPATVTRLFMRGKIHTVLTEIGTEKKVQVEIDIHDAAARKIGLHEKMPLHINLNPKWIFLLTS